MSNLNLIDVLITIQQNKLPELRTIWDQNSDIFRTLEILKVIVIISSDSNLKIELTPLGLSILSNNNMIESMKLQEDKLNSISADLQRIKSSLAAISLDDIRSGSFAEDNPYRSDFLFPKNQGSNSVSEKENSISDTTSSAKTISSTNFEEFTTYIQERIEDLDPSEVKIQKKSLKKIKGNYAKLFENLQQEQYQEFGLEAFLLLDSIFIFLLLIFGEKNPKILTQSLEKKYNLVKNLPMKIDPDLILFLDRFNSDMLNKNEDSLNIGEKTAKKLIGLINDVYKPFISIFDVK